MRVFLTGGSGFVGRRLLEALLAGGHEVVCLARSERTSAERIDRVNVQGTRALIEACADVPIERFLFLSTVVRGRARGELFTEEDEIPATTAYGRSKQRGEELLQAAARERDLPAVILRPSHIYGPADGSRTSSPTACFASRAPATTSGTSCTRRRSGRWSRRSPRTAAPLPTGFEGACDAGRRGANLRPEHLPAPLGPRSIGGRSRLRMFCDGSVRRIH